MLDFETLRILVEHLPDLVSVVDGDGLFEYVNLAHTTMLGFEAEELVGTAALDLIHPDDRAAAALAIIDTYENRGETGGLPVRLRKRDAGWELMYVNGSAFETADGPGRIAFVSHKHDPLKDASGSELERISAMLRAQQETTPDGVLVVSQNGSTVSYNQNFLKIWGLSGEEVEAGLEARTAGVLRHLKDPERLIRTTTNIYDHPNETFDLIAELVDDRSIEIHTAPMAGPRGDAQGRVWFYRDVTERVLAERDLKESEDRYRRLVELSPNGICLHQGGVIRYLNYTGERLLGCPAAEVVGRNVFEFIHPDDQEAVMLAAMERDFESPRFVEARVVRPDGKELTVEVASSGTTYMGRAATQTALRDITERRAAERSLRESEEQQLALERKLLEAQKLESLGVLAGGIAHDFNNLLVAIMGNASLALSEVDPHSELAEYLREIGTASQRAADLAHQMLAYSGKGRFVIQPTDLSDVVREIARLLAVSLPKKATLELLLDDGLPPVDGDATQLRQIIMNLVINAAEAIGDRTGTILLETGRRRLTADELTRFTGTEPQPGEYLFLRVTDDGSGMDAATAARIFDPFFTTKFTGRGLGLAAVLGIVRGHNGAIGVKSALGEGTTFELLLPVGRDLRTTPPVSVNNGDSTRTFRGTAILVDDEAIVRRVARGMLQRFGFEVREAADGVEASELFDETGDNLALVLADLTMPRMDGHEFVAAIRAKGSQAPVIIMSGYAEMDIASRYSELNATFLQKPFTMVELDAAVQAAIYLTRARALAGS